MRNLLQNLLLIHKLLTDQNKIFQTAQLAHNDRGWNLRQNLIPLLGELMFSKAE